MCSGAWPHTNEKSRLSSSIVLLWYWRSWRPGGHRDGDFRHLPLGITQVHEEECAVGCLEVLCRAGKVHRGHCCRFAIMGDAHLKVNGRSLVIDFGLPDE